MLSVYRKTFRYRLYPSVSQTATLNATLECCRILYNAALQERRDAWQMREAGITFNSQCLQLPAIKQDVPEYKQVYSQVLQNVLHRADLAFQAFYRRCRRGETPGYPRFKSRRRYDSFTYPQLGFSLEGNRLRLSKVGAIKVKLHRPLDGEVKTLTLKREGPKWFALFSCIVASVPLPSTGQVTGLDVGLESFAVTSDGESFANPRYLRHAEAKLIQAQQRVSRRKLRSNRRRKAIRLLARRHRQVANARKDAHHKLARHLVNSYDLIAVEDLRIRNMVQNHHLAKSISDASWGQFISILQFKAAEAGREVVLVNPRNTSQICSSCGAIVLKPLSERWHQCPVCRLSLHRDHNAARNILALGRSVQVVA